MQRIEKTVAVEILDPKEFSGRLSIVRILLERACRVRLNAQAPYSHYLVGCSLVCKHGHYFDGCNVERVSYTQTTHAEQNTTDSMVAKCGPCKIKMLAVVGAPESVKLSWPLPIAIPSSLPSFDTAHFCPSCGHCLQIITENCFNEDGVFDSTVPLINYNTELKVVYRTTIGDALPFVFMPQHIKHIKGVE